MRYADSGFILSLYLPETTTAAAVSVMRSTSTPIPLIPLGLLEIRNAFRLAVFRKYISEPERTAVWANFESDLRAGVFEARGIPAADLYNRANLLVERHGARLGTRTLDVLHVAAALHLEATELLTFDRRQKGLARVERLRVLP